MNEVLIEVLIEVRHCRTGSSRVQRRGWRSKLLKPAQRWATGAITALLLWSCAGPDGMYLGNLDRTPGDRRESEDLLRPRPRSLPPTHSAAEADRRGKPYLSPQSLLISSAPKTYFERSTDDRELPFWVVGEGTETVLVLGAQHGNERSSSELVFRFLQSVLDHPDLVRGRRVVIAPLVNPDGLAKGTRENAKGVDLNRNFPANNWRPALASEVEHKPGAFPRSEPETRFVLYLLDRYAPSRIVSVHGAAACVNWDGPAEGLARSMATLCGLPAKASIGYPTPGSTGTYVGRDRRLPIITLELRSNQDLGASYVILRDTLLAAVHYPGLAPLASLN